MKPSSANRPDSRRLQMPPVALVLATLLCLSTMHVTIGLPTVTPRFWPAAADPPPKAFARLARDIRQPVPDTQLKRNLPIELVDGRVTGEFCRMLGWEARTEGESVEVWDAFIFEGELDMLELRLAETFDSINSFFILDASPQRLLSERPSHVTLPPNLGRFASKLHILHLDQSSASAADAQHAALHDRMSSYWAIRQGQRERQIKGLEPNEGIPTNVPRIIQGAMEALVRRETAEVVRACRAGDGEGLRFSMEPFLYSFALPLLASSVSSSLVRPLDLSNAPASVDESTLDVFDEAGWECIACFSTLAAYDRWLLAERSASVVHQTSLPFSSSIQDALCAGDDVLALESGRSTPRWSALSAVLNPSPPRSAVHLPRHLAAASDRLAWLLPGGCQRRSH